MKNFLNYRKDRRKDIKTEDVKTEIFVISIYFKKYTSIKYILTNIPSSLESKICEKSLIN